MYNLSKNVLVCCTRGNTCKWEKERGERNLKGEVKLFYLLAVPPLFVIEFLHRIFDTFEDYFTECSETTLKEHYVIVYEVGNSDLKPNNGYIIVNDLLRNPVLSFSVIGWDARQWIPIGRGV